MPIAAPTTSAMSVAMATTSAWIQRPMEVGCRERVAAGLGEVQPAGDAELGGERLDEHRHEAGGDDDPDQEVAELRAGGDVRREVAGVDVGDGGDEARAEEGPEGAKPAALAGERGLRGAEGRGLAGEDVGRRRAPGERVFGEAPRTGATLHSSSRGAIAQLGERLDRTQEVAGSSPASSIGEPAGNGGFFSSGDAWRTTTILAA